MDSEEMYFKSCDKLFRTGADRIDPEGLSDDELDDRQKDARAKALGYENGDALSEDNPTQDLLNSMRKWSTLRRLLRVDRLESMKTTDVIEEFILEYYSEEDKPIECISKLLELESSGDLYTSSGVLKIEHVTDLTFHLQKKIDDDESEEEDSDEPASEIKSSHRNDRVEDLIQKILIGQIVLNPPWQRGDVWQKREKRKLIKSILRGIPIPNLLLLSLDGVTYALDGKQRLTAMYEFRTGELDLPNNLESVPGKDGEFNLDECRGDHYNDLGPIPKAAFDKTTIHYIEIENISAKDTVRLFELYNTTGQPLKAVEIRNALYHKHPMHKMLFELTGEGDLPSPDYQYLTKEEQEFVTETLKNFKKGIRFDTLELAEKYLGYSRAFRSAADGSFRPRVADKGVDLYWENLADEEDEIEVAREIYDALCLMCLIFSRPSMAEKKTDSGGHQNKRSQARFLTAMIISRIANDIIEHEILERDVIIDIIRAMDSDSNLWVPYKENARTLWDYQAKWVLGFRAHVAKASGKEIDELPLDPGFFESMEMALIKS